MSFLKPKYFDKANQEIAFLDNLKGEPDFDFDLYFVKGWKRHFAKLIGAGLSGATWLALKTGIVKFGILPFKVLARKPDVEAAFEDNQNLQVPFGPEMGAIAGPEVFGLGRDDEDHTRQRKLMVDYMTEFAETPGSENLKLTGEIARGVLDDCGGQIDLIAEYAAPIISQICLRKFGLSSRDPVAYAQWNIAASIQLFARPTGSPERELRNLASASMRAGNCINAALTKRQPRHTLVGYLQSLRDVEEPLFDGTSNRDYLSDAKIRAIVAGMVSGFVPTTTLASGNLFQSLCNSKDRFGAWTKAAQAGDRDKVRDIIMEAARFRPAGDPGHFRRVARDFSFGAKGVTKHKFKEGDLVLLSTRRAMSDKRARKNPAAFCPGHVAAPNFMFGHLHHACVGQDLATEVMTELFLALGAQEGLKRPNLRTARSAGPFLWHLPLTFAPKHPTTQTMITVGIPLRRDQVEPLQTQLQTDAFRHPATRAWDDVVQGYTETPSEVAQAFHATNLVHNASLGVVEISKSGHDAPTLLIEINADGPSRDVFRAIEAQSCAPLDALLALAGKPNGTGTAAFLGQHEANFRQRPVGHIGLCFNGIADFSVSQIAQEDHLMRTVEPVLQSLVSTHDPNLNSPRFAMKMLRSLMEGEARYEPVLQDLCAKRPELGNYNALLQNLRAQRHLLYRPAGRIPPIADHTDKTFFQAIGGYLTKRGPLLAISSIIWVPLLISALLWMTGCGVHSFLGFLGVFTGLSFALSLLALGVGLLLARRLSKLEQTDDVDETITVPDRIREIEDQENQRGYMQNHITVVNKLKPGRFRLALLALGLKIIALEVRHWFRSGFVTDIGTIRQAKWFRLKGTDYLIFQANFDGSWEAYLEDFSNKAYPGQNAAWSHCEGFPRTRLMTFDGARDADQFKRWVRGKQVITPFWYSRFPELSNAQIRRNALIRDGLARAASATEARAWVSYFGSQSKLDTVLETEEVQSLIFNGQPSLTQSASIGLRFTGAPDDPDLLAKRQAFLRDLTAHIGFGDAKHFQPVVYAAFSGTGLQHLGVARGTPNFELESFSSAFVTGMGNRENIMNDFGRHAPEAWDWWDAQDKAQDPDQRVDLMLFLLAETDENLKKLIAALKAKWKPCAEEVVRIHTGATAIDPKTGQYGDVARPFGFKDGISQPVMRGTFRHTMPTPDHDSVAPGEIILGYKDNRDIYPPTPQIDAARDIEGHLPDKPREMPGLFAAFGTAGEDARDLGRNGTYIAVRQVELDPHGFEEHIEAQAQKLAEQGLKEANKEYLAAKIVGRWRSGAPLVRYPNADPMGIGPKRRGNSGPSPSTNNDFLYGTDDPQGQRCPLGSHVRRSNPRDSLGENSEKQIEISNRHRILRRGRNYHKVFLKGKTRTPQRANLTGQKEGNSPSEGLLFVAMNANIERQFEFIQQTYINGHSFHGLNDPSDPLMAARTQKTFNIPTPSGSVVVRDLKTYTRTRGGGYFFMPGRAMLRFLGGDWDGDLT